MTKFNSHIKSLKIVLKPAMPIFEGGQKVADALGKYAQFSDGQFQTEEKEPSPVDGDSDNNLEKLTKKELQALATEKGVELQGDETKDQLIELLEDEQEN